MAARDVIESLDLHFILIHIVRLLYLDFYINKLKFWGQDLRIARFTVLEQKCTMFRNVCTKT